MEATYSLFASERNDVKTRKFSASIVHLSRSLLNTGCSGGVSTIVAEETTNRVAPVFSNSEPARRHSKLCYLRMKTIFWIRLKCVLLKILFMSLSTF